MVGSTAVEAVVGKGELVVANSSIPDKVEVPLYWPLLSSSGKGNLQASAPMLTATSASLPQVIMPSIEVDDDKSSSFGLFKFDSNSSTETSIFKSISLSLFNTFDMFLSSNSTNSVPPRRESGLNTPAEAP
ncbi:TATA-binding protein-associated factor BTAF1 [Senna tora]|uniref:TATA-binding protein-associated factor BTAF1 n=1 Tax=Senna tora TaxID=362788 RepID=A0A835CF20_9FABA|nr:TATA-binding protein-associated factor BTAF1 [Senna tora]